MTEVLLADLSNPLHANATLYLLNEYAKDEMGGGEALDAHVQLNLISELRKRPGIHVVLAFVDQQPAGLAICIEGFSTFACKPLLNIHDLAVVPAFRGQGLARKLLARVEALARDLGCCKLTLEVLEGNQVAKAAYRSFGFAGYELGSASGKAEFWQKKLG